MNKVSIIGVGATGSIVAEMIARLGIPFDCYDFDVVERKNLNNQIYTEQDIGKPKVEALQRRIKEINPDLQCNYYNEAVDESNARLLAGTVFLLVDSMSARKDIANALTFLVDNVIETRLGTDTGRVLCYSPANSKEKGWWESTLFKDEVSVESACGTVQGLYFVACHLASLAVITYKNIGTENAINDLNFGVFNYFKHTMKVK